MAKVEALGFFHEELIETKEVKRLVPSYKESCSGGILQGRMAALPARTLKDFVNAECKEGVELHTRCRITDISHGKNGFICSDC